MDKSDTVMETRRLEKQTVFNFIGALLGSIFGLLGTVEAALVIVEGFVDRGIRLKDRKVLRDECYERAKIIQFGFKDLKEEEEELDVTLTTGNLRSGKTDNN